MGLLRSLLCASAPGKNSQLIVFKYGSISGLATRERPTPAGRNVGASQTQKPRSGRSHVPWRAAARAERQR